MGLTLALSLTLNLTVGLFHIKKSATSINMKEPQPHDSQNRIIEPSDYRTLGLLIHCHYVCVKILQFVVSAAWLVHSQKVLSTSDSSSTSQRRPIYWPMIACYYQWRI